MLFRPFGFSTSTSTSSSSSSSTYTTDEQPRGPTFFPVTFSNSLLPTMPALNHPLPSVMSQSQQQPGSTTESILMGLSYLSLEPLDEKFFHLSCEHFEKALTQSFKDFIGFFSQDSSASMATFNKLKQAVEHFQPPYGHYILGMFYFFGIGTQADYTQGIIHLKKAYLFLAPIQIAEGFATWLKKIVEAPEHPQAWIELAYYLLKSNSFTNRILDLSKLTNEILDISCRLIEHALTLKDFQRYLSSPTELKPEEAFSLFLSFHRSKPHPLVPYILGVFFMRGIGIELDLKAAFQYLKAAQELNPNHKGICLYLSYCYVLGNENQEPNLVEAWRLKSLASSNVDPQFLTFLSLLENHPELKKNVLGTVGDPRDILARFIETGRPPALGLTHSNFAPPALTTTPSLPSISHLIGEPPQSSSSHRGANSASSPPQLREPMMPLGPENALTPFQPPLTFSAKLLPIGSTASVSPPLQSAPLMSNSQQNLTPSLATSSSLWPIAEKTSPHLPFSLGTSYAAQPMSPPASSTSHQKESPPQSFAAYEYRLNQLQSDLSKKNEENAKLRAYIERLERQLQHSPAPSMSAQADDRQGNRKKQKH